MSFIKRGDGKIISVVDADALLEEKSNKIARQSSENQKNPAIREDKKNQKE